MIDSRFSERSNESTNVLPRKQEWAIIYQQRAKQYQKAKSMEKMISQQKKGNFKTQLDLQLAQKHNLMKDQKEEDKKYYDYITQKAQEQKERQEKEKFKKFLRSKEMEEQNRKRMQDHENSHNQDLGKVYNIDIGLKSEREKKERAEAIRKNVIATLDKQREEKQAEKRTQKMMDEMQAMKNMEYQDQAFNSRGASNKKYQQSDKVYNYYRDIYNQKIRKDRDLEHNFVDKVKQKEAEADIRKRERQMSEKERKSMEMKDTLEKQLQVLNRKREQEGKTNPEQANYSFISNIFRDKKPSYDKKQYSMFLDKQYQEQLMQKKSQKYMNEEEYRLNSNQLNKAITGNYTFDRYHDRSMNNIGDRLNVSSTEPLRMQDADLVKTKLQVARSHHKPRLADRSNSAFGPIV